MHDRPSGHDTTTTRGYAIAPILPLLEALPKARQVRPGAWVACCPGHEDTTPSLSWAVNGEGHVGVYCHAGCSAESIVAALGEPMSSLFEPSEGHTNGVTLRLSKPEAGAVARTRRFEATDTAGRTWTHTRHEDAAGRAVGEMRWQPGVKLATLQPYGAALVPSWPADDPVFLVEGEATAEALRDRGLPALATFGVTYKPEPAALAALTGRRVILWPDADDVGRAHMIDLAHRLDGIASALRWVEPPADAFKGWDAADADPDTIARLVAAAGPVPAAPVAPVRSDVLAVMSWADLMAEPAEPPPMIRPGIPTVGVTILAGSPKAGKTLWASQMALEARCPALLIIEEGSRSGISYRMRLQAAELGIETPPITLMHRQRIRLDDRASVARLRAYVAETRPALIVVDPLNRLHSADENKPSQMTPVMDALAELAYDDGGRAVVAIHHVNKPSADRRGDVWDRLRGASSIRSGTDANLVLDGDKGTYRRLLGEFRDAEPLIEHLDLDRTALLFRPSDAPVAPSKVDPLALRQFVEERGQVVAAEVMERFGVTKVTALVALRALGCDEYEGARRRLTFSLATVQ